MKVLFAVDNSKFSDEALKSVGKRPWPESTEFLVLSVVEFGRNEFEGLDATTVPDLKPVQEKILHDMQTRIEEDVKTLRGWHPSCTVTGKVVQGHAKEVILNEADEWGADFLVVGSHGRRGFQKFFLGSVAESIIGHAPCTVEVVKIKSAGVES